MDLMRKCIKDITENIIKLVWWQTGITFIYIQMLYHLRCATWNSFVSWTLHKRHTHADCSATTHYRTCLISGTAMGTFCLLLLSLRCGSHPVQSLHSPPRPTHRHCNLCRRYAAWQRPRVTKSAADRVEFERWWGSFMKCVFCVCVCVKKYELMQLYSF